MTILSCPRPISTEIIHTVHTFGPGSKCISPRNLSCCLYYEFIDHLITHVTDKGSLSCDTNSNGKVDQQPVMSPDDCDVTHSLLLTGKHDRLSLFPVFHSGACHVCPSSLIFGLQHSLSTHAFVPTGFIFFPSFTVFPR